MFKMSLLTNVENVTPVKNLTLVDATAIFGPNRDSLFIVIPITIIYSLIFVTGLLGNIFTCLVIVRNKSMHTATNYYLFSLAISDLLLLISGMPQEMYSIWSKWPYIFGHSFCVIRGLAAETSTNASVLTITLFTVERYLAICHPFVSHKMSKLSRATKHVMLLWVVALGLALPQALQFGVKDYEGVTMCLQTRIIIEHSFELSTFFVFFAPMVLITVLYSLIGLKLRETNINKEQSQKDFERGVKNTHKIRRKHSQSTRRVVKMLVAVVVTFFICWAPFHAQRLVAIYGTNEGHLAKSPILLSVYSFMTYTSGVFYYISTCINPIFYHIMSNKFRGAFKNTVAQWCCRSSNSASGKRCSYTAIGIQRNLSSIEKMKRQDSREKTIPTVQICHNGTSIPISSRHEDKYKCCDYKHVPIEEMKNTKSHNLDTHLLVNVVHEKPKPHSPVSNPIPAEIITISPDSAASGENKEHSDEPENHIKEIKLRISLSEKEYG